MLEVKQCIAHELFAALPPTHDPCRAVLLIAAESPRGESGARCQRVTRLSAVAAPGHGFGKCIDTERLHLNVYNSRMVNTQ